MIVYTSIMGQIITMMLPLMWLSDSANQSMSIIGLGFIPEWDTTIFLTWFSLERRVVINKQTHSSFYSMIVMCWPRMTSKSQCVDLFDTVLWWIIKGIPGFGAIFWFYSIIPCVKCSSLNKAKSCLVLDKSKTTSFFKYF